VFDVPRHARGFFEALVADNPGIGRPHNVEIIFGRRIRRDTPGTFRTAIDHRDNGGVIVNVSCKHSRIKQYLKDGRAMRIETVVKSPQDLGCPARLPNLDELQAKARAANRRILEAERAGQGTVLASPAFERIAHPSVTADGRRTPALRSGDPRVMALAGALCHTLLAATGFTNKNLRVLMTGLLGSTQYTPGQMTYDLRRLRLAGLIRRLPHTNRYMLTADGIRIAIFYTKVYNRLRRLRIASSWRPRRHQRDVTTSRAVAANVRAVARPGLSTVTGWMAAGRPRPWQAVTRRLSGRRFHQSRTSCCGPLRPGRSAERHHRRPGRRRTPRCRSGMESGWSPAAALQRAHRPSCQWRFPTAPRSRRRAGRPSTFPAGSST
jgi:hypothetical protein